MRLLGVFLWLACLLPLSANPPGCACDPAEPASLAGRECSLTREALAQPEQPPVFFLKDINPRKPNRTLAIPRAVRKGVYSLRSMTPQEREQLWSAAIAKAKELWGDQWGLAYNGDEVRTQCQPHLHIGKLIEGVETPNFVEVAGPAQIPVPEQGQGLWVHQHGDKLHVHLGELLTETVLLR
jgi:diadenosine tetraphosphate (Ap4A) HIT family hydrolase